MDVCKFTPITKKNNQIYHGKIYISSKNSRACIYAGHLVVTGTPRVVVDSSGGRESNNELEIHTYIIIESKSHPINQTDPKNRIEKNKKGKRERTPLPKKK